MNISQIIESISLLLQSLSLLRAIVGFILVFLLPGFAWSLVFFPRVNILERVALSFGLSIAIVTLSIIVLNVLLGMRITVVNSLLTIVVIVIIPLAIYYLKRLLGNRSQE